MRPWRIISPPLKLGAPRLTVFSNTTAGPYPADPAAIARQLVEHLVSRVEFVREIAAMYEAGARIFVEVGPGQVLTGLVGQILGERHHLAVATNQAGRSGLVSLLHAVAQLMAHGVSVKLEKIYQGRSLNRLKARTRDQNQKYTPSTWMVNGAKARPFTEFSAPGAENSITPFHFGDAKETSAPASALRASMVDAPVGNQPDQVMRQYQRLMQRFLETQKAVMLKYLESAGQARVPVEAAADVAAPLESTVQPMADRAELASTLLKIVSDRTGYPPEMLGLNLDLEADLGIDSIKRTEIIGHFLQTMFPPEDGGPPEELIELSRIKTLGGIIERVAARRIPAAPIPSEIPVPPEPSVSPASPTPPQAEDVLPRFTLAAVPAPAPTRSLRLAPGRVVMITDDGRGIAAALVEDLHQRGLKTALIHLAEGHLPPRQDIIFPTFPPPVWPTWWRPFGESRDQSGPWCICCH